MNYKHFWWYSAIGFGYSGSVGKLACNHGKTTNSSFRRRIDNLIKLKAREVKRIDVICMGNEQRMLTSNCFQFFQSIITQRPKNVRNVILHAREWNTIVLDTLLLSNSNIDIRRDALATTGKHQAFYFIPNKYL